MKFYADLHIHSRYSRATSKELTPENLWIWAQLKGLQVVGTGDCIHPQWLKELKKKLEPAESGFFQLKQDIQKSLLDQVPESCRGPVRFVLSTEISNIYKKNDKVRKVHNLIIFSSLEAAKRAQKTLDGIGNIRSDGRPILGLDAKDLLEVALESDAKTLFIPAHIWTPWFSVLGSKSGFDSIHECYEDLTPHIYAVETGLSSDPLMNWRLEQLDDFLLVSNSDAHSASKLAREANIFDCDFSYEGMYRALSNRKDKGFLGTVEFFPEEGKYHYDGHRECKVRWHPQETIAHNGLCSVCGKKVVVGVMARVEELATRKEGVKSKLHRPYQSIIPLSELISGSLGVGSASKKVQGVYFEMLKALGSELSILLDKKGSEIKKVAGDTVAEGIKHMRKGEVNISPGFDGEFGKINVFSKENK